MKFIDRISECIKDTRKRHYLKGVPVKLINTTAYKPPRWYWTEFWMGNSN